MEMVMCLDCGQFQPAVRRDTGLEAIADACERCGGTSFEPVDGD